MKKIIALTLALLMLTSVWRAVAIPHPLPPKLHLPVPLKQLPLPRNTPLASAS